MLQKTKKLELIRYRNGARSKKYETLYINIQSFFFLFFLSVFLFDLSVLSVLSFFYFLSFYRSFFLSVCLSFWVINTCRSSYTFLVHIMIRSSNISTMLRYHMLRSSAHLPVLNKFNLWLLRHGTKSLTWTHLVQLLKGANLSHAKCIFLLRTKTLVRHDICIQKSLSFFCIPLHYKMGKRETNVEDSCVE